ncbi:MAG: nucleoside-diphosphate sugar epimerase/dehydratase [Candidatus Krumholzibacteriia bacterium]
MQPSHPPTGQDTSTCGPGPDSRADAGQPAASVPRGTMAGRGADGATVTGGRDPAGWRHLLARHRLLVGAVLFAAVAALGFTGAFVIRFELPTVGDLPVAWTGWWLAMLPGVVALRAAACLAAGLHRSSWRHAAARDALPTALAAGAGTLAVVALAAAMWGGAFPRSVLAIDAVLHLLLLAGVRYAGRVVEEVRAGRSAGARKRVLVIGAGVAGSLTVRTMRSLGEYWPVALLDDDPDKQGSTLFGVPVTGPVDEVEETARRYAAEAVVVAIPTATTRQFYRIVQLCRATGLPLKTVPDLAQILSGSAAVARVTDFCLEDLLDRRPMRTDPPEIRSFLAGRTVLVTGAAGSIGSELCSQIVASGAGRLLCLDRDENGLFRLEHALRRLGGSSELVFHLADIRDRGRLEPLFAEGKPAVVFHAAAYKHVPILQHHPVEAIRTNVGGTRLVAELAHLHGAEHFVFISTDKAVRPTSVMGATKRIAERVVRAYDQRSATRFCAIRFGNVLGSNGSVVELFRDQIRRGGPVTVTHPEIERYFMTIPEAVHLVLCAATMGRGGETYILDMGEPIRIDQLARQIIQLSGLSPDVDVPIVYTGLRPGEKLYEELWSEGERPAPTAHRGILQSAGEEALPERLEQEVIRLLNSAADNDLEACWTSLLRLVPTFQGERGDDAARPPRRGRAMQA